MGRAWLSCLTAGEVRPMQGMLWVITLAALAWLVLYPLSWLLAGGFQTAEGAFTLSHFTRMFSLRYIRVLSTTLQYAAGATALACGIGIPLAWAVARSDLPGKRFISACTTLTFVNPPFLQAMAYTFVFSPNAGFANLLLDRLLGIKPFNIYSLGGMIVVTALGVYPQVFLIVDSALRSMDPSLEEAAAVAGAKRWYTLSRITLPLVMPAILSSAILTAVMVLALFAPPAILGIPAKTYVLTTQIYILLSSMPMQLEFAAALSILFIVIAGVLLYGQALILKQRSYTTIAGRGLRPNQVPLGRARPWLLAFAGLVVLMALIVPVALLFLISLFKAWGNWFAPGNVTLGNYADALVTHAETREGFRNSLLLGVTTVAGTLLLGLLVSSLTIRARPAWRALLQFITFLPFSVPGVVFTVGVILAFIRPPFNLYGGLGILIVCYLARFLPLAAQPIGNGLRQIDWSLLEAAQTTGARWRTVLWRIVLPLTKFIMLSTGLLVFMSTVRELVSAVFLYSAGTGTVMVAAWHFWEEGKTELSVAVVMLLFFAVLALYLLARRLVGEQRF